MFFFPRNINRKTLIHKNVFRYYVQPQWIFDSVNRRELLPVEKYLMGAILPPHLSPFVNEGRDQVYVPPEERELKDPNFKMMREVPEESEEEEVEEKKEGNEEEKEENEEDSGMEDEDDDEDESKESADEEIASPAKEKVSMNV